MEALVSGAMRSKRACDQYRRRKRSSAAARTSLAVCARRSGPAWSAQPNGTDQAGDDHHQGPKPEAWHEADFRHADTVVNRSDRLAEEEECRMKRRRGATRGRSELGDKNLNDAVQEIERAAKQGN